MELTNHLIILKNLKTINIFILTITCNAYVCGYVSGPGGIRLQKKAIENKAIKIKLLGKEPSTRK